MQGGSGLFLEKMTTNEKCVPTCMKRQKIVCVNKNILNTLEDLLGLGPSANVFV